jgi:S-formylglutathione hydrolase FrmB
MPAHVFARPRGRTLELQIDSEALRGNLLGDPSTRTVAVYLPEGYDDSDADYPLVVDLAGFTGSGLRRLAWTAFGESVPQRLDRLVAEGSMGPVIAAFPDAFTSLGGNQYIDSLAMGGWSTFLVHELVPRLEAELRLRRGRAHRAVLGKSSGGYGALLQGLRHADTWAAVACHSGDMGFDRLYLRDFPPTLDAIARHGGIAGFVAHVAGCTKLAGRDVHALMILAMGATYDPDPAATAGVRLPVDLHTGELHPERWAAWLRHDPVHIVEEAGARQNLARLAGLWIDCGRRDQYYLHYGARSLHAALQRHGIAHVYEEFDDDHSGIDYRLDRSLPFLHGAITRA